MRPLTPPPALRALQANTLHQQIQEIQARKAVGDRQRQGDKSFLQLRQAQLLVSQTVKRKEELNAKMERLQEKKSSLTQQYEKMTVDGGGGGSVSEEEWRGKYETMKVRGGGSMDETIMV